MNERELNQERRKQRALERLGSNHPRCVVCGCDDPLALELHHIAGRAFDEETVTVCRNHHRRLSDWQKDHSLAQAKPDSDLAPISRFLDGLADLFEMLVKRLREFAAKLAVLDQARQAQGEETQP
jgi:hypothetical protein